MSPHKNTTSPQQPDRGQSATQMGIFGILAEIVGVLLAVFVGFMFLVSDARPDIVAWILFVIGAVLAVDMGRRIVRAKNREQQALLEEDR